MSFDSSRYGQDRVRDREAIISGIEPYQRLSAKENPSSFDAVDLRKKASITKERSRFNPIDFENYHRWDEARKIFGSPTALQNEFHFEILFSYFAYIFEKNPYEYSKFGDQTIFATSFTDKLDAWTLLKQNCSGIIVNPVMLLNASTVAQILVPIVHPKSSTCIIRASANESEDTIYSNLNLLKPMLQIIIKAVEHNTWHEFELEEKYMNRSSLKLQSIIEYGFVIFQILHERGHYHDRMINVRGDEHPFSKNVTFQSHSFDELMRNLGNTEDENELRNIWKSQESELFSDAYAAQQLPIYIEKDFAKISLMSWFIIADCIEYLISLSIYKEKTVDDLSMLDDRLHQIVSHQSHPSYAYRFHMLYKQWKQEAEFISSNYSEKNRSNYLTIELLVANSMIELWKCIRHMTYSYAKNNNFNINTHKIWNSNQTARMFPPRI